MPKRDAKCLKCGHTWQKRSDNPIQCPKCRNRKWKDHTIRTQIQMKESEKLESTINVPKFEVSDGSS